MAFESLRCSQPRHWLLQTAVALAVTVVLAWTNGVFAAPPLAGVLIFAGVLAMMASLLPDGVLWRMGTLAAATGTVLVGLALAEGSLGESSFMLFLVPGYLASVVHSDGRCGKRAPREAS